MYQEIRPPCRVLFTGRSTMGKTTLAVTVILECIMPHMRRCFAACPTFYDQSALEPLRAIPGAFPERNVFTDVTDGTFEYIYQRILRHSKPTLLFVDDAAAEKATNRGNKGSFSRLCLCSMHHNLTIIGVFQRITSASPSLRDNVEGLVSFIPTKDNDGDTICHEFNPCPARLHSRKLVMQMLDYAWRHARFCFIWREKFSGQTRFYSGFQQQLLLNATDRSQITELHRLPNVHSGEELSEEAENQDDYL